MSRGKAGHHGGQDVGHGTACLGPKSLLRLTDCMTSEQLPNDVSLPHIP